MFAEKTHFTLLKSTFYTIRNHISPRLSFFLAKEIAK
jgi:hypothetical protein